MNPPKLSSSQDSLHQWVLMGHRGVGKTSLLKLLKERYPGLICRSLDELIVQKEGSSIQEIFSEKGEAFFREQEQALLYEFVKLHSQDSFILDVGAGFKGVFPSPLKKLWIKRRTSSPHHIFLDRPCLGGKLRLGKKRFEQRENFYRKQADLFLEIREGCLELGPGEQLFFDALFLKKSSSKLAPFHLTLNQDTTELEKNLLCRLGLKGFEWRDDLLTPSSQKLDDLKATDIFSHRQSKKFQNLPQGSLVDWPLEWGSEPRADIQSLHSLKETFKKTVSLFSPQASLQKLALPIQNFRELMEAHQWFKEDPSRRVFLPLSPKGRWTWYRLLMASQMNLNFVRTGASLAPDQPSVLEALNAVSHPPHFAAVLGSPVDHSFTPCFHQDYFASQKAPVFSIQVEAGEFPEALPVLEALGLKWAALTSPLKNLSRAFLNQKGPINTLFKTPKGWKGTNTDPQGMGALLEGLAGEQVAVWGGGGVLPSIEEWIPEASFYSSRSGELKKGKGLKLPKIILWAVGAKRFDGQGVFPPSHWPIEQVVDLNYAPDSPGLECAALYACQYRSGLIMFRAQAKAQQAFWERHGV